MPFVDTWLSTLVLMLALPLWLSPFIGWFLFVSAFTKRSPLLVAALPIVLLPLLEKIFFDTELLVEALFVRSVKMPLFEGMDNIELLFPEDEDFHKARRDRHQYVPRFSTSVASCPIRNSGWGSQSAACSLQQQFTSGVTATNRNSSGGPAGVEFVLANLAAELMVTEPQ